MNMGYYEKIHRATISEPYIDNNLVNLNFTSHFHEEIEIIYVIEGSIKICVTAKIIAQTAVILG